MKANAVVIPQKPIIKNLIPYQDDRGMLYELLRNNPNELPIGQVYLTTCLPGVVKAWHLHEQQTDRMVVVSGLVKIVAVTKELDDKVDDDVFDFILDGKRPQMVIIPKNYWHGFKNLGPEEAMIINIPDKQYNADTPDEFRKRPSDNLFYRYDWYRNVDG